MKGAEGIVFDGYSASVQFLEGTCADLFDACDEPADLVFQSLTGDITAAKDLAVAANQALLEQVFGANPLYDINPGLTFGCEAGTFVALVFCGILTPYYIVTGSSVVTASLTNRDDANGELDQVGFGQGYNIGSDSTAQSNPTRPDRLVYASWDLTPVAVTVPAAVWLFGTALIGLFGYSRRKRAA